MTDRVSWLLIEPGWKVLGPSGKKVGKVAEVLGDEPSGIFHGLVVNGDEILAERIADIHEGEVHLAS
jgi:sporulation protein YlmC with PRC-barrel domain